MPAPYSERDIRKTKAQVRAKQSAKSTANDTHTSVNLGIEAIAHINKLPREIYHHVLRLLPTKALSALSLTSKGHRSFVEPTLYREIWWRDQDLQYDRHPPIDLLLRSVLNRPTLASYIHCFVLSCYKYGPIRGFNCEFQNRARNPPFTSIEMHRITSLIKSLHVPSKTRWKLSLKQHELDLFVALLISQLVNLRYLHLDKGSQATTRFYLGAFLNRAARGNFLPPLEHVEYSYDISNVDDLHCIDTIDLDQVKPLFSIPTLKSISLYLPPRGITWPGSKAPISGLQSMDLHHSLLWEENLGKILLATPFLKSLKYDAWIDVDLYSPWRRKLQPPKNDWEYFDCAELGHSLSHVQQSLEKLYISLHFFSTARRFFADEVWNESNTKFRGTAGKLETLRDFKHLSSLTMPTALLSDWTEKFEEFDNLKDLPPRLADLLPVNSLVDVRLSDYNDLYKVDQAAMWADAGHSGSSSSNSNSSEWEDDSGDVYYSDDSDDPDDLAGF